MATFSKILLSQSTIGAAIGLSSTSAPGVLIHTTQTNSSDVDEVWIYASNFGTSDVTINVYWGDTGATNYIGPVTVQAYGGATLIAPGLILKGNGSTGSTVYATASVASTVNIYGYVNRITA